MDYINYAKDLDKELFFTINGSNYPAIDNFMVSISSYEWWAMVFVVIAVAVYVFGERKISEVIFYLLSVGVSVVLANVVKLFVMRARPIQINWESIGYTQGIYQLDKYSSSSSFFSSHSASAFCIAMFAYMAFKRNRWLAYIAFIWAVIVGYSRIYVGKHFPSDVFVGMLVGIAVGYVSFLVWLSYSKRENMRR